MDRINKAAAAAINMRVDAVDALVVSPEIRAQEVWLKIRQAFPELTDWDLVCFASNYLGFMSSRFLWLEEPAKHVVQLVYTAHYLAREEASKESGIKHDNRTEAQGTRPLDSAEGHEPKPEPPRKRGGLDVSGGGFT